MEILECGPERPVGSSMWGCNQKAGRGILSHKKLNTHTRLATVDDIGNGKQALRQTKTFKNSCSQNSGDNWKSYAQLLLKLAYWVSLYHMPQSFLLSFYSAGEKRLLSVYTLPL